MAEWPYDPPSGPLVVLHVDRDMVVIDKPSGLLSVPGKGPGLEDCAESRVAAEYGTVYPAQRLDMDTSGVLVFARRRKAEAELHRQFREHLAEKTYLARVAGHPAADAGIVELALSIVPGIPRSRVDPEGRPARTAWRVRSRDPDGDATLELRPSTGRPHQLRLHLLAIGHPILGDRFYAPPDVRDRAPRLMLHAASLTVRHPFTAATITFRAAAPFR
jgi:tRNA pseudouridine32 synthase/23S rRNA pseudouridine746 synthase